MSSGTLLVTAAAIAAGLIILFYWRMVWRRNAADLPVRSLAVTFALVIFGFVLCAWSLMLDRPAFSYSPRESPVAIAIAFDLSPSMLAIPDPEFDRNMPPRYVRARDALLGLISKLEERQENVLVSLIGFTRDAEVLMGWDRNTSQLGEFVAYGLSPGLFTKSGTSMEAAVDALVDVFDMLPQDLQYTSRRIAILISDGEDTLPSSFLGYAIEELASSSFDVIALQAGLLDKSEGVPRYGQVDEFIGFEAMGGDLYTQPNVEAMTAIADATMERGLYVRAEDSASIEQMLRFVARRRVASDEFRKGQLAVLGLFAVVALLCARLLK